MSNIELSHIFIYPVKSLAGISLSSSKITPRGLQHDRRWMLINNSGLFITQRIYPQLSLIHTEIIDDKIKLTAPNKNIIMLPLTLSQGELTTVRVWNDNVDGMQASNVYNKWISEYLGVDTRFVYMPETVNRPVDNDFSRSASDSVSFADGFPFLLISNESFDDLNRKLNNKNEPSVNMNRFRPNLVVQGCKPYAEDEWPEYRMGGNHFYNVKPCSRCIMTTVDAKTGEKGTEPLKTLLEYRKKGDKAYFGQNVLIDLNYDNSWNVSVGDVILLGDAY